MSEVQPATKAVYDAVLGTYADNIPKDKYLWRLERLSTIAALKALVDTVFPAPQEPYEYCCDLQVVYLRNRILTIIGELESMPWE